MLCDFFFIFFFYSLTGRGHIQFIISNVTSSGIPNLSVFHRGMLEAVRTGQKIPISLQTWSTQTVLKAMEIPGDLRALHDPLQDSARAHKVTFSLHDLINCAGK